MDEEDQDPNLWFHDTINPNFVQMHRVRDIVYSATTRFQSLDIVETCNFGTCLILDGKLQSSDKDEFIYHEALVHPAMISHHSPVNIFIAGGGEGATLREVLAHRTVGSVVMVDIDEEAVNICRRFLGPWHADSFDDPRVQLLHMDARNYLANCDGRFDVIIIDLTDPIEGGPSYLLYTQEFYEAARSALSPDGVLSLQAGSCSYGEMAAFSCVINTLRAVFPQVWPYQCHVPSFGGSWGFALASCKAGSICLSSEEVDGTIPSRMPRGNRFYDGITHRSMFSLPRYLRDELHRAGKIITDQAPLSLL